MTKFYRKIDLFVTATTILFTYNKSAVPQNQNMEKVVADIRYDEFFLDILQEKKTIVGFLQTVFSFLARRTDFYHEAKSLSEGLGMPPGVKEKLVHDVMLQCDPKCMTIVDRHGPNAAEAHSLPSVVAQEVEIESSPCDVALQTTTEPIPSNPPVSNLHSSHRLSPVFHVNEHYNGARFENYCWSQTITELELYVLLPQHISSAKQLSIKIDSDSISIRDKLTPDEKILEGKLAMKCRSSEAVWSVSNRKLQITLDKSMEAWWDRFLVSEPKLDLSQMDCSRPLEELPEESQAAIEKFRWDQQQKLLGLPTSDDTKNEALLRQAWDAEGSPFRGQPFDPSIVRFN